MGTFAQAHSKRLEEKSQSCVNHPQKEKSWASSVECSSYVNADVGVCSFCGK